MLASEVFKFHPVSDRNTLLITEMKSFSQKHPGPPSHTHYCAHALVRLLTEHL